MGRNPKKVREEGEEIKMECKECRRHKKCIIPFKDKEGWAEWCEDFLSRYKDQQVEVGDLVIYQSGLNHHIMIIKKATDKMIFHTSCTKRLTKKELKDYLGFVLGTGDVLPPPSFDKKEWHDDNS